MFLEDVLILLNEEDIMLFEEINAFLTEKGMTKVEFIKKAYEIMKKED